MNDEDVRHRVEKGVNDDGSTSRPTALTDADRLTATYRVTSGDAAAVAEAISVEQTIEFPADLAAEWIRDEIVGVVEQVTNDEVTVSFNPAVAEGGLNQLLNVLWGNVSLFDGVRLVDIDIPPSISSALRGPRFGIDGLRERCAAASRPLLMTALKPMGRSPAELAETAATLAMAGFDIIKDDHTLADQPWAPRRERIAAVAAAVATANAHSGSATIYAPSLNTPADRMSADAREAIELGAGGLLVLPGLSGFDAMRALADEDELGVPIITHPAFLGAHVIHPDHGIRHGVLFGTITRLAGADISAFPNYGGRFSFAPPHCADIDALCRSRLGELSPIWPSPGGGMTIERMPEIIEFYGRDVVLLIGGALHRGDLAGNARRLVDLVHHLDS